MPWISDSHAGCIITVHAAPRASRTQIQGTHGNALKIRLQAPPVDGKANRELLTFLAKCLDISAHQLELLSGDSGRLKRILVRNRTARSSREQLDKYFESKGEIHYHTMMNRNLQHGFSLMELMVVAMIVSILVAVAVPLANGNRRRAWATEAQVGCGTVRTALRIILNNHGEYPTLPNAAIYGNIKGIASDELDGKWFHTTDYRVTSNPSNYVITCTGTSKEVEGRTVILNSDGNWSGTLLE